MAKIRISKKDQAEYKRLARNTKAKVSRTQKKYGVNLSSEVNIPSLDQFSTRKEFNAWKQEQESFTNRGNLNYQFVQNKYGVVATKKELVQAERNTKVAQRKARELQEKVQDKPFISGGKVQGTVGQQMKQVARPNVAGVSIPGDFNFEEMKTKDYFDSKAEKMMERADPKFFEKRMVEMKENYIASLEKNFNSLADVLVEDLKKMPADIFYELYLMFDELDFDYHYTTDEDGLSGHVEQMRTLFAYADSEHMNFDLKGF